MYTYKKIIAIVLSALMAFSVFSTTAFAFSPADDIENSDFYEEYMDEMEEIGLSKEQVSKLGEINKRIAVAKTMREVDELMGEYYDVVAGTLLAITTATSIYTSSGGDSLFGLYWRL